MTVASGASVRHAAVAADWVGYDGNKKTNGRKRHIAVDTLGLLVVLTDLSAIAPTASKA